MSNIQGYTGRITFHLNLQGFKSIFQIKEPTSAKLFELIQWYNLAIKSKTQKPHYLGTL